MLSTRTISATAVQRLPSQQTEDKTVLKQSGMKDGTAAVFISKTTAERIQEEMLKHYKQVWVHPKHNRGAFQGYIINYKDSEHNIRWLSNDQVEFMA